MSLKSVLLLSNGPQEPYGYGVQIGQLARQLRDHGYRVAIQAFHGVNGAPMEWDGITVYPASSTSRRDLFGLDLTPHYMDEFGGDLLITLSDAWCFNPMLLTKFHVAHWMPVDSATLGDPDISTLRASGAIPIAMSRAGQDVLKEAGYAALYAPHGIDTDLFSPPEDREGLRRAVGIEDDEFIVISANANMDLHRKAWPLNLAGFAKFHERHPRSRFLCHTPDDGRPEGLNLARWARRLGIGDVVEFADDKKLRAGGFTQEYMASVFYAVGDCYLGATRAEGFGLTLVEAAACGVPTIATNFGAMKETGAAGVLVEGTPFESVLHSDWWMSPSVEGIDQALEFYWQMAQQGELPKLRQRARDFALGYDHRTVFDRDWVPALAEIETRIDGPTVAERVKLYEGSLRRFMDASEDVMHAVDDVGPLPVGPAQAMVPDKLLLAQRAAWQAYRDSRPEQTVAEGRDEIVAGPDLNGPVDHDGTPIG